MTIFADLNNTDLDGRVRLITAAALYDIKNKNIILFEELEILLDDKQEFKVPGVIDFKAGKYLGGTGRLEKGKTL